LSGDAKRREQCTVFYVSNMETLTAGLPHGTVAFHEGSNAEPGTGCTASVAALASARTSWHWKVTGVTSVAVKAKVAPRPVADAEVSDGTGRVASTVNSCADTRA
jgi:hypothetical protein